MQLTRESEYALRGLLALMAAERATVERIATRAGLPRSFLAKVFQKLSRHGIVVSRRGPGSGYSLAVPPSSLPLGRILEAIEGPGYLDRCVFWGGRCGSDDPCMLHARWSSVKPAVERFLNETSLADLAQDGAKEAR